MSRGVAQASTDGKVQLIIRDPQRAVLMGALIPVATGRGRDVIMNCVLEGLTNQAR